MGLSSMGMLVDGFVVYGDASRWACHHNGDASRWACHHNGDASRWVCRLWGC